MNDERLFQGMGRHLPPEGLKRRVMDEIAMTPQERPAPTSKKRPAPLIRWAGWAALPVAASVALWLALPTGVKMTIPQDGGVAATVSEELSEERLLAALDEIYGVESTYDDTIRTNGEESIRAIYGIDGEVTEERNDA